MSGAHTPTPWKLGETCVYALDESGKTNRVYLNVQGGYSSSEDKTRTSDEEILATAKFIVRAVNAHDDLVAALNDVMDWIGNWDPNFIDEWPETSRRARAALAKAEQS